MIGLLDSFVLARAKLHSKRFLLLSTIIVSGLLFAALFAAIIIFTGTTNSANKYSQAAYGGKYLVKSTPVLPSDIFGPSIINLADSTISDLNAMQTAYIGEQKALATRLKISFDASTIPPVLIPNSFAAKTLPDNKRLMINTSSPVYGKYLQKLQQDYVTRAKNKQSNLKFAASQYGASLYQENTQASVLYQTMTYLKDGKEDLTWIAQNSPANGDASTYGYTTSSVRNSTYTFVDDSLVRRFILPANKKRQTLSSAIPVIITTKEAVDLFGAQLGISKTQPTGAPQQIAWMKTLQERINGVSYSTCYRNQADSLELTQAAQTLTDIESNKNNAAYATPSLIYNLPTEACGGLTVKADTRTAAEKAQIAQQIEITKELGSYEQPVHKLVTFQIVGVMPVTPQAASMTNLPAFLSGLLSAQYGVGAIIPAQMYSALPIDAQHRDILQNGAGSAFSLDALAKAGITETIVTFKSLEKAKAFMNSQGCPTQENCNKPFVLEPYGENYLLINDLRTTIAKILQFAFLGAICFAIIIVWFMMSRVITDSRRETAVFRALGAKRRDVASIYLLYSLGVAGRILLFTVVLGTSSAFAIQYLFGAKATSYAQASYGVIDSGRTFSLIGFGSPLLIWLVLCIIGVSTLAVLPPLIRNLRRNPINDMRDE